jgi:hypothetical protein
MPNTASGRTGAANIEALVGIRDHGGNAMAKVHAAKTLETMLENVSDRTGLGRAAQQKRGPRLQIVILPALGAQQVVTPPTQPLIEATPTPEVVPVPTDSDDRS